MDVHVLCRNCLCEAKGNEGCCLLAFTNFSDIVFGTDEPNQEEQASGPEVESVLAM